jgi:hypothetical protein
MKFKGLFHPQRFLITQKGSRAKRKETKRFQNNTANVHITMIFLQINSLCPFFHRKKASYSASDETVIFLL